MKISKELVNSYLSYRCKKDGRKCSYIRRDIIIKKKDYYQPPLFIIKDKKG